MEISEMKKLVKKLCIVNDVELRFMRALIETESDWNQWAVKYEIGYRWIVEEPKMGRFKCSPETIRRMQSFSYGLCQIMGNNFYDFGYEGFCTQLFEPKLNITVAIKMIKKHMDVGIKDLDELYSAYNAGSVRRLHTGELVNQANVDRFMKIYKTLVL